MIDRLWRAAVRLFPTVVAIELGGLIALQFSGWIVPHMGAYLFWLITKSALPSFPVWAGVLLAISVLAALYKRNAKWGKLLFQTTASFIAVAAYLVIEGAHAFGQIGGAYGQDIVVTTQRYVLGLAIAIEAYLSYLLIRFCARRRSASLLLVGLLPSLASLAYIPGMKITRSGLFLYVTLLAVILGNRRVDYRNIGTYRLSFILVGLGISLSLVSHENTRRDDLPSVSEAFAAEYSSTANVEPVVLRLRRVNGEWKGTVRMPVVSSGQHAEFYLLLPASAEYEPQSGPQRYEFFGTDEARNDRNAVLLLGGKTPMEMSFKWRPTTDFQGLSRTRLLLDVRPRREDSGVYLMPAGKRYVPTDNVSLSAGIRPINVVLESIEASTQIEKPLPQPDQVLRTGARWSFDGKSELAIEAQSVNTLWSVLDEQATNIALLGGGLLLALISEGRRPEDGTPPLTPLEPSEPPRESVSPLIPDQKSPWWDLVPGIALAIAWRWLNRPKRLWNRTGMGR